MKKGFTLVELLAIIVILGIITIIAIPKIQEALNGSQEEAYSFLVTRIENKASDYVEDNNLAYQVTAGVPLDITLQTLIDNNYLETKDLEDPRESGSTINPTSSYVRFTLEAGNLVYKAYITLNS